MFYSFVVFNYDASFCCWIINWHLGKWCAQEVEVALNPRVCVSHLCVGDDTKECDSWRRSWLSLLHLSSLCLLLNLKFFPCFHGCVCLFLRVESSFLLGWVVSAQDIHVLNCNMSAVTCRVRDLIHFQRKNNKIGHKILVSVIFSLGMNRISLVLTVIYCSFLF